MLEKPRRSAQAVVTEADPENEVSMRILSEPARAATLTAALFAACSGLGPIDARAQGGGMPMSGAEFEAYTEGRTLSFSSHGTPYGIEQYLPGRRVRWAFIGDTCQEGIWFERDETICFVYDYNPTEEQCWIFTRSGNGLRGVFEGPDGPGTELYEVQQSDRPLTCSNLDVGV